MAIKEMEKKIDIIRFDYLYDNKYNYIDHTTNRIKSQESILEKMRKKELKLTYKNMIEEINDIAGIRIICPLKDDVFKIKKLIKEFNDVKVIKEKDYVTKPKKSGYMSYHIVCEIPIFFNNDIILMKVEIQIRSLAMDFWASLEHDIRYKPDEEPKQEIQDELIECAKTINKLDNEMINLYRTAGKKD